jgi:hypothetical protein
VLKGLSVQSVLIITKVVSSNPARGEVYSIQHYVIKFPKDLQQVDSFFRFHRSHDIILFTFIEVNMIASSGVDWEFEPRSDQSK